MNDRKLVLYIAATLDGYIATEDDDLDWLMNVEGEGDNGYGAFYDTVDTILMGRRTYDWIMAHDKAVPYVGKECYVFSTEVHENNEHIVFVRENPVEFLTKLKKKDGKRIWIVGGGKIIDSFIRSGTVDEIIINIAPILLGKGIPLFLNSDISTRLFLKEIKRYNQFAELHYDVLNK